MIDKKLLIDCDLILFHTKGFSPISFGIRELTGSFWNHCGFFYEDIDKQGWIIEALGDGVVKTPVEKYLEEKQHILKVVRVKKEAFYDELEYKTALATALSRLKDDIGKKYDWGSIAWLGIKYIIKGYWHKGAKYFPEQFNLFNSRDKFFCSELIAEAFWKTSTAYEYPNLFAGNKYYDTASTTPKDIAKSENVGYVTGKDVL